MAQLEQLAELRDRGILTEEEFTAKKAQVLGISWFAAMTTTDKKR